MTSIGWLHLTDLHQGTSGQKWLWPQTQDRFFEDLGKLHRLCGPWDLVLFTGDLTQRGTANEFRKLEETLGKLWDELGRLGSCPILLAVPGNHDLERPDPEEPEVKLLRRWSKDAGLRSQFWDDRSSRYRLVVERAFQAYTAWWSGHRLPRPDSFCSGTLPGDFAATIDKGGVKLGVVGLNSAFLQLTAGSYRKKLAVSAAQLHEACGGDGASWARKHRACLLLTHHGPDWLDDGARGELEGEVAPPGRFAVHLFGHMHESSSSSVRHGGAPPTRLWQATSLCGLEHWGTKRIERRHGYAVGRIEIEAGVARLRMWPRRMSRSGSSRGAWWMIPDHDGFPMLCEDQGTPAESISLHVRSSSRPPPRAAEPPHVAATPYRVLALSTDHDLREARERIAAYLTSAMGVQVVEGPVDAIDPASFDFVLLVQGFWWDDGRAASTWERARPDQRALFVPDEQSDWPPRRLTEAAAQGSIQGFRERFATGALIFRDPAELPERVGELVSQRLSARRAADSSAEDLGLRPWERQYLAFRLPAWEAGRTAAGRTYLVDAEGTTDLYRPELYVPLDGISGRWVRGDDGRPCRFVGLIPDGARELFNEEQRRIRLSQWVSIPDLPRVALVGAPGGGKTVFLTRVAAALGCVLLGRQVELETLDLEALRGEMSTLPIPVLLEATHIAKHDCRSYRGLLSALLEELGASAVEGPTREDIEKGLRAGRYLLFVDGLDEIANSSKRAEVLQLLKGIAAPECFPRTRLLVTTRSARYTGGLSFGPELEVVDVAPAAREQVETFCARWSAHRKRDERYRTELLSAVTGLFETVEAVGDDRSITGNPLMLTAVCLVYERYRSLPEDRGQLCMLLVDDLCRSRRSEDPERSWRLEEPGKRDLLQRIALGMQQEGAQSWAVTHAQEIALAGIGVDDPMREARAIRHVQWVADHTGLLRFEQPESGQEQVRFWHRLFREYLAASALAQKDRVVRDLVNDLWHAGWLVDPFWEDVIRLLPRALGTREKADGLVQRLQELAGTQPKQRGRLLGLIAAAIIESRELFPMIDVGSLARDIASTYEREGDKWTFRDRLLVLHGLGRLDPIGGDPRLSGERWIDVHGGERDALVPGYEAMQPRPRKVKVESFRIAWAPVTVQEYAAFVNADDRLDAKWWGDVPDVYRWTVGDTQPSEVTWDPADPLPRVPARFVAGESWRSSGWREQLRLPNAPVVRVTWYEAVAYCRWRTAQRTDGAVVRLPTVDEWDVAAWAWWRQRRTPRGAEEPRHGDFVMRPVGAFPTKGAFDLLGNLDEWCGCDQHHPEDRSTRPARGRYLSAGVSGSLFVGYPDMGFRCVLIDPSSPKPVAKAARSKPKKPLRPARAKEKKLRMRCHG